MGRDRAGTRAALDALRPERAVRVGRGLRRALATGFDPASGAPGGPSGRPLAESLRLSGLVDRRAGAEWNSDRAPWGRLGYGGPVADLPHQRNLLPGRDL